MEESGERSAVVSNTQLAGRSSSDAALSLITYCSPPHSSTLHVTVDVFIGLRFYLMLLNSVNV